MTLYEELKLNERSAKRDAMMRYHLRNLSGDEMAKYAYAFDAWTEASHALFSHMVENKIDP